MLTKCPECQLQVSDKALVCPHCGYPLKTDAPRKYNPRPKHRRLPNGFGQISEIKNRNLRKPFRAMVTVGTNSIGRPICRPLKPEAYFATYNDAYAALLEYNRNPYDLSDSITMQELYDRWSPEYCKRFKTDAGGKLLDNAWLYCSQIYGMRVIDLKVRHIKGCIYDGVANIRGKEQHAPAFMQNKIKILFNQMLDYAVEYELVDHNYARDFSLSSETRAELQTVQKEHLSFTDAEMETLWQHVDDKRLVDVIVVQCYSGWRPQELGLLEIANVDLDKWTFTGGIKTEAGINRTVPIHTRIRDIIKKRYAEAVALNSKYLFNWTDPGREVKDTQLNYGRYRDAYKQVMKELKLNPDHRPHDGRKHFVTMAKKYGVDEYAIKYMIGHKIYDITERVYTDRDYSWLHQEIAKIK